MAKRGGTVEASLMQKHKKLEAQPRTYKHIWHLCCTQAEFDEIAQLFMNAEHTLLYPQRLLPVPLNLKAKDTVAQWCKENLGTTSKEIPVEVYDTTISFESCLPQLSQLTVQLSERMGRHELLYKYASDDLLNVEAMGNLNYSNGRLLNRNVIQSPQAFACSLWRRDLFDLCCKRSLFPVNLFVDEVEPCGVEAEIEDWVLAQED